MKNIIRIKNFIFNSDYIEAIEWKEEEILIVETRKRTYEIKDVSEETWKRLVEMVLKN